MPFPEWKNRTALVTGASSGLGAEFGRLLAQAGVQLILVARREDHLRALAAELHKAHGVRVEVLAMDLGEVGAPDRLYQRVQALGLQVDLLVNNAGFGTFGPFLDQEEARERAMLELDVHVPLALTRRFGSDMVKRRLGWILQVASIGAYQPCPLYASYGAAKAFILNWGEALHHEWKDHGVTVTVLSPGVTATEFFQVAGQTPTLYQRLTMMDPATAAGVGLRALARKRLSVVPGMVNKMGIWNLRFTPRAWVPPLVARLMRNQ